jgi:hypothetical protein
MWDWITEKWDLIEWGTAMQFFAAVGTVGALVVAYRLLRREADRDEVRAAERRKEQAKLISAWVRRAGIAEPTWELSGSAGPEDYEIAMMNSSGAPVYKQEIFLKALSADGDEVSFGSYQAPVLPPGPGRVALHPPIIEKWRAKFSTHPTLVADMMFTDGAGHTWFRTHEGVLAELHRVDVHELVLPRGWAQWLPRHDVAAMRRRTLPKPGRTGAASNDAQQNR